MARALATPALIGTQPAVLVTMGMALALLGALPAGDQAGTPDRRVGVGLASEDARGRHAESAQSRQRRTQRSKSRTSSSASDASAQIVQYAAHSPHSSTHGASTAASTTSGRRGWVWRTVLYRLAGPHVGALLAGLFNAWVFLLVAGARKEE